MEEVKEWNGKPRWMWVWDAVEECKKKDYVICILTESEMKECEALYPVKTIISNYSHCAEIEEEPKKKTRLTNYELSQLLKCLGKVSGKNLQKKLFGNGGEKKPQTVILQGIRSRI